MPDTRRPFRPLDSWRNGETATAYGEFVEQFPMYRETSRDLVERAGVVEGTTVLDLACGTGATTMALLQKVGAAGRVIGLDGSSEILAVARQAISDPRVEWVEAEAEAVATVGLPVLDAVVCNSAFWQFDMPAVLKGLAASTRAGAPVAFNIGSQFLLGMGSPPERDKPSLLELMAAIAVLEHDFVPRRTGPPPSRHGGPLTPERVESMLVEAGFILDSFERAEYATSVDAERAWLSIPIFTEISFAGLTYEQRMDCLAKAYQRVDERSVTPSAWGVFVARKAE